MEQGKGMIRFFFVLLVLVFLLQLFYMFPTRKVEKRADEHAAMVATGIDDPIEKHQVEKDARVAYLDSISDEVIFKVPLIKEFTYNDLKKRQLALGLDLKGGMSTVLQVDLEDFLKALSNNSRDPEFLLAASNAKEALKNSQSDYITLFAEEFEKTDSDKNLAAIFMRNESLRDQINYETSNAEVVRIIRAQADETVDRTYKRIKDRIDKFGVVQPNVFLDKSRDLISVELPGVSNPARAREYLQASAKLEFWNTYRINDGGIFEAMVEADRRLKGLDTTEVPEVIQIDTTPIYDDIGNIIPDSFQLDTNIIAADPFADQGPLLSVLNLNRSMGDDQGIAYPLTVIGATNRNQKDHVMRMLNDEKVSGLFPRDLKFLWSRSPITVDGKKTKEYELYMIRKDKGKDVAPLEGDVVTNAFHQLDQQSGEMAVSLKMNGKGARIWGDMTTKANNDGNREIAIALDDEVVSAPRVNVPILSGDSQITGNFSIEEARDFANILQVGKLPAKTETIQESLVGPSLGAENINKSIRSLVIGLGLVLLFMALYYAGAGIIAIIALLLNLFFIFGSLASYGTVLTLPGIAGIVLTIGMAVDANVIIFERIREELHAGKSLMISVADGFKHSYSAIIDANVTTLLTAAVLAYFGLGPIKGFAVVLIIGILCSLFSAVLIGRLMIDWWVSKGNKMSFWTPLSKNVLKSINVDWVGKRKYAYIISGLIILAGVGSMLTRKFELGVDFKGGYSYNVTFDPSVDIDENDLRASLTDVFGSSPVVKAVDAVNTYNVTTSSMIEENTSEADDIVMRQLFDGVNAVAGGNLDFDNFSNPEGGNTHVTSSSKVGPTIADDIQKSSIEAGLIALLLIFFYILIRFSSWEFSVGAIIALFHDSLIVLSMFSIFHGIFPFSLEIDQAFIAALLTVIGYSMNDTVIVFDRIREFLQTYLGKTKKEVINLAINATLSRTVITSLTTLFVVAVLFVFGGASIKGFSFALMIGVLVGTYSSIFVATPVMYDISKRDLNLQKNAPAKKSKGFSKVSG
jgi:SecD/SecF fusion protein